MRMRNADVVESARMAGQVKRYHTWPTITTQSVGEHTWQVMRLYHELWGELPQNVALYLMYHDASEVAVGDPPFPVKARNPALKAEYDRLEDVALGKILTPVLATQILNNVSDAERRRMKICDLLDMHQFGLQEEAMGNGYAHPITQNTAAAIQGLLTVMTPEEEKHVSEYLTIERGV